MVAGLTARNSKNGAGEVSEAPEFRGFASRTSARHAFCTSWYQMIQHTHVYGLGIKFRNALSVSGPTGGVTGRLPGAPERVYKFLPQGFPKLSLSFPRQKAAKTRVYEFPPASL